MSNSTEEIKKVTRVNLVDTETMPSKGQKVMVIKERGKDTACCIFYLIDKKHFHYERLSFDDRRSNGQKFPVNQGDLWIPFNHGDDKEELVKTLKKIQNLNNGEIHDQ